MRRVCGGTRRWHPRRDDADAPAFTLVSVRADRNAGMTRPSKTAALERGWCAHADRRRRAVAGSAPSRGTGRARCARRRRRREPSRGRGPIHLRCARAPGRSSVSGRRPTEASWASSNRRGEDERLGLENGSTSSRDAPLSETTRRWADERDPHWSRERVDVEPWGSAFGGEKKEGGRAKETHRSTFVSVSVRVCRDTRTPPCVVSRQVRALSGQDVDSGSAGHESARSARARAPVVVLHRWGSGLRAKRGDPAFRRVSRSTVVRWWSSGLGVSRGGGSRRDRRCRGSGAGDRDRGGRPPAVAMSSRGVGERRQPFTSLHVKLRRRPSVAGRRRACRCHPWSRAGFGPRRVRRSRGSPL